MEAQIISTVDYNGHSGPLLEEGNTVRNIQGAIIDKSKCCSLNGLWINERSFCKLLEKPTIHEVKNKFDNPTAETSVENECNRDPIQKLSTLVQDCKTLLLTENYAAHCHVDENIHTLGGIRDKESEVMPVVEEEPISEAFEHKSMITYTPHCALVLHPTPPCTADIIEDEESADGCDIHEAVRRGNLSAVEKLLAQGADPDEPDWAGNGDPPILQAAARKHVHIIKALCVAGCDVNGRSVRGETALHVAVSCRPVSRALVEMLLHAGCRPNTQDKLKGQTALHCVASYCDEEPQILLLLASVTDVDIQDYRQNTVLHCVAATTTNCLRLQQILDVGAKVSVQNDRGETALCVALQRSWQEGAVALVHSGTDLHLTTLYHETALHVAARKNQSVVVAALLDHGAAVNTADLAGNTPLHLAAGRGYMQVVQLLLTSPHTDLNAPNKEGSTPLHIAVESGFIDVVQVLAWAEQTDLKATTTFALTALDLAKQGYRRNSQPEMLQMLTRELERRQTPHLT